MICGYQPSGHYEGKHVDIEEVFIGSVQAMFGKLSKETLAGMCDHAITGPGVCAGMGTANSMHIVCEALGMTLPGAAPVLANSPRMFDIARQSGRRIVEMVWEDLTPRRIMTPGAFRNAAASVLAVSGSINCIKHLQATAVEAGVDVDLFALFNELGAQVPVLSAVAPNGPDTIDAFEAAGGAQGLLKQLEPLLDGRGADGDRPHHRREPRERRRSPMPTSFDRSTRPFATQRLHRRPARLAGAGQRDRQARPATAWPAAALPGTRSSTTMCRERLPACRRAS